MPPLDVGAYVNLIALVDGATSPHEKGARFEDLGAYVLSRLDGVEIQQRDARMEAEEIDLLLWSAQMEEILRPWDSVILVECKNWSAAVGAPQLESFIGKLRRRSLRTGIFIAANGVTGDYANGTGGAIDLIKSALQDGIRVITITMDDLRALTSTDDLRNLIKRRYCGLYVHKVLG
jgi:hypothetical protein